MMPPLRAGRSRCWRDSVPHGASGSRAPWAGGCARTVSGGHRPKVVGERAGEARDYLFQLSFELNVEIADGFDRLSEMSLEHLLDGDQRGGLFPFESPDVLTPVVPHREAQAIP